MRTIIGAGVAALLLAGCGGETAQQQNDSAEETAKSLQPGEYELTAKVDQVRSTDGTSPATALKAGAEAPSKRACVAADGSLDPKMFAEASDVCTTADSYVRNGRMSVQLKCTRAGQGGNVMQLVDGDFRQDSFEAKVLGSTSFSGSGDYEMARSVTAKRVGDCPAGASN
jgi:PBP1b-binding outer membrane lipoprotein LpoB